MSTPAPSPAKPILQYNFEEVNGQLIDLSGNGYDASLPASGINTINDPIMGNCLQFNGTTGDFIKIDNLPAPTTQNPEAFNGLTMTAWVNVSAANGLTSVLQLGTSKVVSPSGQENKYTGYAQLTIKNTTLTYRWWGNGGRQFAVDDAISLNTWLHLAVTVDTNGETIFYIDGQTKPAWQKTNTDLESNGALGWSFGNIGADGTQTKAPVFTGMMAWAGFYQGAMSQAEIQAEMELGQSNRHFVSNRTFPVDFKLFSDDAGAYSPIMFIDSAGLDQTLDFHLVNSGKKPLSIPVGTGTVDATDNYHFQLRFRPGILSDKYLAKHTQGATAAEPLLASTSWSTLLSKDASNNDVMSFLYTGSAAKSIDVGKEVVLQLDNINASATGGSKNTNVEFKYKGIDYGSSGTSAPQIEGYRTQNISIVNHTGDKNIPLRAKVAGMASVMTYHQSSGKSSDPSSGHSSGQSAPKSELLFHLVNTGTEALPLGTSSSTDGATAFTLSVDVQPQNEFMDWALFAQDEGNPNIVLDVIGVVRSFDGTGPITLRSPLTTALDANTTLQIEGVSDTVTVGTSGAPAGSYTIPVSTTATIIAKGAVIKPTTGQGAWTKKRVTNARNQMQWTITNNTATSFEGGKGLFFMLSGIECSLPAGFSVVTISYENVPGHWDGQFELPVRKFPMAFNQNLIGINTQNPKGSLHIEEENNITPIIIGQKPPDGSSTYISSERISIASPSLNKNAGLILPYPEGANNNGIVIGDNAGLSGAGMSMVIPESSEIDPLMVFKNGLATFVVDYNGSVGIGTGDPKVPLHIDSNISFSSGFLGGAKSGYNYGTRPPFVIKGAVTKPNTSIFANGSIIALSYAAMSDQRAKEHLSLSNPNQSLATLLKLKVSDYQYIDFVGKGTGQKKGLIAQQLKEHFPQAVSDENTDFIPNIYAMATDCQWQPITKHLRISLEKDHDLKVGDKVRLIAEDRFEEKKVVAVPDEQSFVVAQWEKPVEQLFVFGKEVHDFHTVDYDQVAMLGVSAIQALHAEVEDLKKENEALKAQMQSEMAGLKAEWAAFKSSVTKQYQN